MMSLNLHTERMLLDFIKISKSIQVKYNLEIILLLNKQWRNAYTKYRIQIEYFKA